MKPKPTYRITELEGHIRTTVTCPHGETIIDSPASHTLDGSDAVFALLLQGAAQHESLKNCGCTLGTEPQLSNGAA